MAFNTRSHLAVGNIIRSCAALLAAMFVSLVFSGAAQAAPGDLDPTFSDDGLQTTPFLEDDQATDVAIQSKRQDRGGRRRRRLRARPLQPQRDARHELLRRRQADDRLRGLRRQANGVALQRNGKIVAVGQSLAATSRSPATTPTARSTRASPATASRRPTSGGYDAGERGGAPGQTARSSRSAPLGAATSRSPATTRTGRSTRASPATASRRPSFGGDDRGERGGAPGGRQDRRGRARRRRRRRRLRARPLQPQRDARPELLRGRQAEDQLRRRAGWRSRATARSWRSAAAATSRSPATTPTGRSTRASPATAGRRPTSGATTGRPGWRSRATARSWRSAAAASFALARYNANGTLDTSLSGDGKQTTDFGGADGARGVALQGDGKIVAVGHSGGDFALARYLGG